MDKQTIGFGGVKQQGTNKLYFACPLIIRWLFDYFFSIFVLVEEKVFFGGVVGPDIFD